MLMQRIGHYISHVFDLEDEPKLTERRITARKNVNIHATIRLIDTFCDLHISDVSATGAMGKANAELKTEQTIYITVDDELYHAGVVKWISGREFGFRLPNASQIFGGQSGSMDHGERVEHHSRATRTKISATGRLAAGLLPTPAIIRNISNGGMLLQTNSAIQLGQFLMVQVGHAMPAYGRAQWCNDGRIGFMAEHPISVLKMLCEVD